MTDSDLIERLRYEADISDRPGQMDRLNALAVAEVKAEAIRTRRLHPGNAGTGYALAEEYGELAKAILNEPASDVRKEAVQTAAMAARIAIDGDSLTTGWRKHKGLDVLGVAA